MPPAKKAKKKPVKKDAEKAKAKTSKPKPAKKPAAKRKQSKRKPRVKVPKKKKKATYKRRGQTLRSTSTTGNGRNTMTGDERMVYMKAGTFVHKAASSAMQTSFITADWGKLATRKESAIIS